MASKNDKHPRAPSGEHAAPKAHHTNPLVYYGTLGILVITVFAFVIVPALPNGGSGGNTLTLGSWDGKNIAFVQGSYFFEQVNAVKDTYESQGFKDVDAYQVWLQAFNNTVIHYALLDMADENGITVSQGYLDSKMRELPVFMENGVFSRRKYRETTTTQKSAILTELREQALKERFIGDATTLVASGAEKAFLKSMAQSQRSVEYVAFPFSAYPDQDKVDFAKAHADLFKRLRLSRVTLTSSSKEADEILSRVKTGTLSFEDAAKNYSKDSYQAEGGDMGYRYVWELRSDMKAPADIDTLLALGSGELSPVFETLAGSWVFFRVDEAASEPDYASADLVRSAGDYISRNEKGLMEDHALKNAEAFAAGAASDFAGAAAGAMLTVKATPPFSLNYGAALTEGYFPLMSAMDTAATPELAGADRDERFLETAFSLEAGAVSEPVILNDYAIVMRLKEISTLDEETLGMIDSYYSAMLQDSIGGDLARAIMDSPKLEDNFLTAYTRALTGN